METPLFQANFKNNAARLVEIARCGYQRNLKKCSKTPASVGGNSSQMTENFSCHRRIIIEFIEVVSHPRGLLQERWNHNVYILTGL
jgi:hypothetical protein